MEKLRFIDLFCGIGGFRVAMDQACIENDLIPQCVFSSDIDPYCQDSYEANFGHRPTGDITKVDPKSIPDHDILFAGFPCQPFSIIGQMKGFDDTRGTLFFHIANIIKEKQPKAFVLENVKQLVGHDKGKTLKVIIKTLKGLGYQHVQYTVLNALDYGLPQKRERVIIVGHKEPILFSYPSPIRPFKPLNEILEKKIDKKHYASDYIKKKRKETHKSAYKLSIWHENKAGNICSYPYSCALRAGASYNYLLVNGERRLTPREMFRLQGFPDTYKIITNDTQARKQAGNAVPVNMVKAVILKLLPYVATTLDMTNVLREYEVEYNSK
ncbi:MAG: DNA (cytosine-5-)-methyltransferase [Chitinophagaceae bacterium]|jgi:DNA (cytosine-5)-methyltransferase 1|nr:DNA (cytosine-5-)-methyltransferase [Chitinophagaceae bacterium]MBK7345459.1 DNA (cytosine-5-)-methyltransferase [Chitinophagaceae bacterium]MBK8775786.1 DNA (cytosine-5-)-methyltransferase [Chitinophagaceae bacterium]MBK8930172.1 DNA (cytosine-5-)-methyltransferase [Chitinophagaceae bacterium]MBL0255104.1 DNA (cytosine-5-)-methyltransferase [Chitinophagaceae bacterium]